MADSKIQLAEVVAHLREELLTAMAAGEGQDLRLEVDELHLELQVMMTRGGDAKAGAKGKVKFWVFDADASAEVRGSYGSSQLQKVTLKLKPKRASSADPLTLAGGDVVLD